MPKTVLENADLVRLIRISETPLETREKFEQYLTPYQTARLAASFFSNRDGGPLRCLDLGAGTGILSAALFERYGVSVSIDAVEIDANMASICEKELTRLGVEHKTFVGDALGFTAQGAYDRVVLNPPYRKLSAANPYQDVLPVKVPNIYAAFVVKACSCLSEQGECVAIIPRSWMNGPYFASFRAWVYSHCSIDMVHIYDSRRDVFNDTDVLQEVMIVKFSRLPQSPRVLVSTSTGKADCDIVSYPYPFESLVDVSQSGAPMRVKPDAYARSLQTLREIGLLASTGKVVEFRQRDYLRAEGEGNASRLLYPCNFITNGTRHPIACAKPQWISELCPNGASLLLPAGSYVVVKRFSSKEQPRRVMAFVLQAQEPVALENHLNYVHAGTARHTVPLDELTAKGVCLWLNSSYVDETFRAVSGSTQVNASDLNAMPIPDCETLQRLGELWNEDMDLRQIDGIVEGLLVNGHLV